jgi:invasion protein IalB
MSMMAATMVLTALTTPVSQPASAQAPDGPPAAWRVECSGDGKTLDCRAVQQVFQRETRQLVLSAVVRPAADAKTGAMLLTCRSGSISPSR